MLEISLDTLGTLADRQATVPDELRNALKDYGRKQYAVSFTGDEGADGRFLQGFIVVTPDEAEVFVESDTPEQGVANIVARRKEEVEKQ